MTTVPPRQHFLNGIKAYPQASPGHFNSPTAGPVGKSGAFWRFRPHTRIVRGWKKAFKIAKDYVYLNNLEAEGFISRHETKALKDLRMIWADG